MKDNATKKKQNKTKQNKKTHTQEGARNKGKTN